MATSVQAGEVPRVKAAGVVREKCGVIIQTRGGKRPCFVFKEATNVVGSSASKSVQSSDTTASVRCPSR
jgi:hypothetical protein